MNRMSVEELLKQNPHIDPESFKEAEALTKRLREQGLKGARYRLATPRTDRRGKAIPPPGHSSPETHSHLSRRH